MQGSYTWYSTLAAELWNWRRHTIASTTVNHTKCRCVRTGSTASSEWMTTNVDMSWLDWQVLPRSTSKIACTSADSALSGCSTPRRCQSTCGQRSGVAVSSVVWATLSSTQVASTWSKLDVTRRWWVWRTAAVRRRRLRVLVTLVYTAVCASTAGTATSATVQWPATTDQSANMVTALSRLRHRTVPIFGRVAVLMPRARQHSCQMLVTPIFIVLFSAECVSYFSDLTRLLLSGTHAYLMHFVEMCVCVCVCRTII